MRPPPPRLATRLIAHSYTLRCSDRIAWLDTPLSFNGARNCPIRLLAACSIGARTDGDRPAHGALAKECSNLVRSALPAYTGTQAQCRLPVAELHGCLIDAVYHDLARGILPIIRAAYDLGVQNAFAQLSAHLGGGAQTSQDTEAIEGDLVERARLWLSIVFISSRCARLLSRTSVHDSHSLCLFTSTPLVTPVSPDQLLSLCEILQSSQYGQTSRDNALVAYVIHHVLNCRVLILA